MAKPLAYIAMLRRLPLGLVLCALLAGCGTLFGDRGLDISPSDYDALIEPPAAAPSADGAAPAVDEDVPPFPDSPLGAADEPPIPELYEPLAAPPVPLLADNRLVTVAVTDQVAIKDVLFEMARQAGVDIEIDPRIAGGVVFSARDRPFLDVIDRIADLAGLRWTVDDGAVRVELDEPYFETYRLPQLDLQRTVASETSITTGLSGVSGGGAGGATGGTTGGGAQNANSGVTISNDSSLDLFTTVQTELRNIVVSTRPAGLVISGGDDAQISVNPRTGVISVFGTSQQQAAVDSYLAQIGTILNTQVLIEGRVIEVNLNEGSASGIDWNAVVEKSGIGTITADIPYNTPANISSRTATSPITLSVDGDDANALINVVEEFGTVRLLSSPRLTVLNNQVALLKVAQNFVYFTIDASVQQDRDNDGNRIGEATVVFNSTIQSVPVGFVMSVQPSINQPTGDVMLNLRPTVTQISSFVPDPALRATLSSLDSNTQNIVDPQIPVVDIREIESVLKLQSGQVAVLGGLMQQRATLSRTGLPFLRDLDLLGRLFGSDEETTDVVELVILLRATIVPAALPDQTDRRLYKRYTRDPRPLTF